ncbi:hypothetical protein ANCCAN_07093 [Ancylostoma caninum]|uniref:Uncharacterized protein n=1 Tax=Ancylostoma caninum TaxID=29170 RepID=A0A368GRF8_ANCCA|nr:hypothetical protein ANCCAN_07093 [Ancylostoma caninum]
MCTNISFTDCVRLSCIRLRILRSFTWPKRRATRHSVVYQLRARVEPYLPALLQVLIFLLMVNPAAIYTDTAGYIGGTSDRFGVYTGCINIDTWKCFPAGPLVLMRI